MPRPCTACRHPQREEIDRALVNGEPFRNIAKRFGTSSTAVFRHKDHLPTALVKAHEAREVAHADDLLSHVRDLGERALRVLGAAEEAGDLRAATGAIREARGCLELLGKVTGELVEKHAHLHAAVPTSGASQEARRAFEAMPEDDRRVIRRIAQRLAIRGPSSPRPLAEEIREIIDPELLERDHTEAREALIERLMPSV